MSRSLKSLAAICAMAALAAGCTTNDNQGMDSSSSSSSQVSSTPTIGSSASEDSHYEAEQPPVNTSDVLNESATCTITFSDSGITASGKGARASDTTVTISSAGVYYLSGTSSNAKVLIEAGKKDEVTLVLDGVSLTCANGAVIDCEEAGSLVICTKSGTVNSLTDSASYSLLSGETEPDAAVFCRSDLTLMGEGELKVTGNYNDAIKGKDNLQIISGTYSIKSDSDGITGKDSVTIYDGTITIESGKDGIKSSQDNDASLGFVTVNGGKISIRSDRDGIQAQTAITIYGGNIEIVSGGDAAYEEVKSDGGMNPGGRPGGDWGWWGGGSQSSSDSSDGSTKGLKAKGNITVYNKETVLNITSADDAIHSNSNVTISGGQLTLSSCDDGIHADELLTVNGGTITITKSYEGLEGKCIAISGGIIDLVAADDGMNAAGGDNGDFFGFGSGSDEYYISITGGDITVNANGDGIDSNGNIIMSGGKLVIYGPTNSGNGAIDYERTFTLSGGELIALGSVGMAETPSALSQPCFSVTSSVSANSTIEVRAEDGTVILSATTPKVCQSLIFSSSSFVEGSAYSIYVNGTLLTTLTAQNGVVGSSGSNGGGFGGNPGGGIGGNKPGGGMGGNKPGGGRI